MTHKRNARAPRPDPAAQDPMDYLLDDVMQATDKVATELRETADLEADPLATLAGHCHTLAGRVAALAEVVRQMRDMQRGLVVISDPPMPAPVLMTEATLAELDLVDAQRKQAARTLVRWRMGLGGHLEPVYADETLASDEQIRAANAARSLHLAQAAADQDLAAGVDPAEVRDGLDAGTDGQLDGLQANLEDELEASQAAPRRWTPAEALAEAERLGGAGGAIFLMHWQNSNGGA